jgi:arginyl-tRNA--protein-N-Asp/Glu arginylyltransferase
MTGPRLQVAHFLSDEHACDYLADRRAITECRVVADVTPEEMDRLLACGWRRFGAIVFRPACRGCGECVPLRIPVADFTLSRSQRRARNRCAHLTVEMGPPRIDDERLALYARWHAEREQARGWPGSALDAADYDRAFGHCAREVLYRDAGTLVGVGTCDETATAYSAVFFFHEPAQARLSLGVNHVVTLVERARREGKSHVYLGFRVLGCPSMRYKAQYLPHELLEGRPDLDEVPRWRRVG